jgi:hypothetical protein
MLATVQSPAVMCLDCLCRQQSSLPHLTMVIVVSLLEHPKLILVEMAPREALFAQALQWWWLRGPPPGESDSDLGRIWV